MCEIEPIGPMETIEPGKEVSFTEYWYLIDYSHPLIKKTNLADIITQVDNLKVL